MRLTALHTLSASAIGPHGVIFVMPSHNPLISKSGLGAGAVRTCEQAGNATAIAINNRNRLKWRQRPSAFVTAGGRYILTGIAYGPNSLTRYTSRFSSLSTPKLVARSIAQVGSGYKLSGRPERLSAGCRWQRFATACRPPVLRCAMESEPFGRWKCDVYTRGCASCQIG
jgi:hypothetical protein